MAQSRGRKTMKITIDAETLNNTECIHITLDAKNGLTVDVKPKKPEPEKPQKKEFFLGNGYFGD